MSENDNLREQVEISKEFMESAHGRVLKYGTPREAKAYYDAIGLVDDALECRWDTDRYERDNDDMHQEFLEESRQARAEGYRTATMADQRRKPRYSEQPSNRDGSYFSSGFEFGATLAVGILIGAWLL